jgi:hypothetical protein
MARRNLYSTQELTSVEPAMVPRSSRALLRLSVAHAKGPGSKPSNTDMQLSSQLVGLAMERDTPTNHVLVAVVKEQSISKPRRQ